MRKKEYSCIVYVKVCSVACAMQLNWFLNIDFEWVTDCTEKRWQTFIVIERSAVRIWMYAVFLSFLFSYCYEDGDVFESTSIFSWYVYIVNWLCYIKWKGMHYYVVNVFISPILYALISVLPGSCWLYSGFYLERLFNKINIISL